eukprot:TRINITY_DN106901_c0_g1_i1.p1 TRINITY_DN106901_c0_g1~~TRINITY_DN106901_c0_g1_i1.p1  ORF type:complete len:105 (+),score=25.07 TRINITY_DN106901_c0_g1_i1:53-367(+)
MQMTSLLRSLATLLAVAATLLAPSALAISQRQAPAAAPMAAPASAPGAAAPSAAKGASVTAVEVGPLLKQAAAKAEKYADQAEAWAVAAQNAATAFKPKSKTLG